MGGTINYERAFFTDKYLLIHPEHEDKILQLKELKERQKQQLRHKAMKKGLDPE